MAAQPSPRAALEVLETRFRRAMMSLQGSRCGAVVGAAAMGRQIQVLFDPLAMKYVRLPDGRAVEVEDSGVYLALDWAAWRLEAEGRIACSSTSSTGIGSHMDQGIQCLKGCRVLDVQLVKVSFDLHLTFDGDVVLAVFCDQTNRNERLENYSLRFGPDYFTVGSESALACELSTPNEAAVILTR